MSPYTPVLLSGCNLGERHQHLNALVNKAFDDKIPIQDVIAQPETSLIDRIFKIDLASKHRCVDYILQNLKDDSMLYVSRALKSFWLLDTKYSNIINPDHLETIIYPEMTKPAVNKMKHWIQLHLKDPERCAEFYNYYKSNFDDAFRYIWHCSNKFILSEFPNIVDKLTPKEMKILFEMCPEACMLYFEILPKNKGALSRYLRNEREYFKTVICLLKGNAKEYLDIVEKYYNKDISHRFSPATTQYLLKNCKNRVMTKIELYVSSLLHVNTFAAILSSEEAKELIYLLARAEYLSTWFTYKTVEPFIKRVKLDERAKLKKQVFVEKDVGSKVKEWPYDIPKPFKLEVEEKNELLNDVERYVYIPHRPLRGMLGKCKLMKRSAKCYCPIVSMKSPLDKLFDQYRFAGFEHAFNELRKKLLAESTIQGRLNIMLVLVSKSGGVSEQVEKLLKFLVERHKNEPNTMRAAVVRSLVKRGSAWRLQEKPWQLMLEFGRDLGLDGAKSELLCQEGLHAVVIRYLLNEEQMSDEVLSKFLTNHSLLSEYKLSSSEKMIITKRLPPIFLPSNPEAFLDAILEYKLSTDEFPDAKIVLVKLAETNDNLVNRLYNMKVLRRELFIKIFSLKQTEEAYMNVLRHDILPLEQGKVFATLVQERKHLKYDKFLQSLKLYFGEPSGLAELHCIFLEKAFKEKPKTSFARPICILSSDQMILGRQELKELNTQKKYGDKMQLQIYAAFRANLHKTSPSVNIDELNWQCLGAKAVATKVLNCRSNDKERYAKKSLDWRRTARISLGISLGTPFAIENFIKVCQLRPMAALKVVQSTYFKQKDIDPRIWTAIKSILINMTPKSSSKTVPEELAKKERLLEKLSDPKLIPKSIEKDYRTVMYNLYSKYDEEKAVYNLKMLVKLLPDVQNSFIDEIANEFIEKKLTSQIMEQRENLEDIDFNTVPLVIVSKSLLIADTESRQQYVLDNICDKFFDVIESLYLKTKDNTKLLNYINEYIFSLKYTKAFLGSYANPLPVFERVLKRLHKILPTEEYFGQYAEIHLTMLYYKTLQQAKKIQEDIFENPLKMKECIKLLGRIFGKYIGFEVNELVSKYFKSITDLYKDVLHKYIDEYFAFSGSRDLFVTFVIKGLLEVKSKEATLVAEYLLVKRRCQIKEPFITEIISNIKQIDDIEVKFYMHCQITNMFLHNRNVY